MKETQKQDCGHKNATPGCCDTKRPEAGKESCSEKNQSCATNEKKSGASAAHTHK